MSEPVKPLKELQNDLIKTLTQIQDQHGCRVTTIQVHWIDLLGTMEAKICKLDIDYQFRPI